MVLVQIVEDNTDDEGPSEFTLLYQMRMEAPRNGDYIELPNGRVARVDQVTWRLVRFADALRPNIVEVLVR